MSTHPTVTQTVEIDVLGGLAVRVAGQPVPIRGEIARALLARLALTPGVTVPSEELVRELWAAPPENAAVSVRGNIGKLRATALGDHIGGGRGGYVLEVPESAVDIVRLRSAARAARAELIRGGRDDGGLADIVALIESDAEPVPELVEQPFARTARSSFREERRFAAERLAELSLDDGDPERALVLASGLSAEHPLADEPVRLVALALARLGRTSDAIAAIDDFGDRLAEAQGIELPPVLAVLRQAVLRLDPDVVEVESGTPSAVERHGIPLPITQFVGRAAELATLAAARTEARLVTIVGPGGVGKTRLAVESARRTTTDIDEIQWLLDLTTLAPGSSLTALVADAVGASEPTVAAVARLLDGRRTLLILDNAEHVLASARSFVKAVLESCAGLAVLVTSREPLRLPGERVVHLAPFTGEHADDAIALFTDRAMDARHDFDARAQHEGIARLCGELDGIPLALELAPARLDVMELGQLASSLRSRSAREAAAGQPMTAELRHESLAAAIRWSIDLLDPTELEVLSQLAAFAGTFDLAAAAAVCAVTGADAAEETVRLAQKSLVAVVERAGSPRRYRLLESVKALVLAAHPIRERDAWRRRHLDWFGSVVDAAEPRLRSHDRRAAWDSLEAANADLALALDTAVDLGDRAAALRITGGQAENWMRPGLYAEGRAALERAFATPGTAPAGIEARALFGAMLVSYQGGDIRAAFDFAERGVARATEAGDRDRLAMLHGYLAYASSTVGELTRAKASVAAATELLDEVQPWASCTVLLGVGQAEHALGHPARALAVLTESRKEAERIGYTFVARSALYATGKVLIGVRRGRDAIDLLVPGAAAALADEQPIAALSMLYLAGGACALIERHAAGLTILEAVDRICARWGFALTEADAEVRELRPRLEQALSATESDAARARSTQLGLPELLRFAAAAPARSAR